MILDDLFEHKLPATKTIRKMVWSKRGTNITRQHIEHRVISATVEPKNIISVIAPIPYDNDADIDNDANDTDDND